MPVVYEKICLWGERYPLYRAAAILGISNHSMHRAIRKTNSSQGAIEYAIKMANLHNRIKNYNNEYCIYTAMLRRCNNKKAAGYENYGGRGIAVCDRWSSKFGFCNFLDDMGPRPDRCSIDRIDNSKGYSPDNCRWSTSKEQARNRRSNYMIAFNDETKTLVEWCEYLGLPYRAVRARLKRGDSTERAFRPVNGKLVRA